MQFVYMSAVVATGCAKDSYVVLNRDAHRDAVQTCVLMLRLCLQFVSQIASAAYRTNKGMSVFDFGAYFLFDLSCSYTHSSSFSLVPPANVVFLQL